MKSTAPHTILQLQQMKNDGKKIACVTAYDASFAAQAVAAGMDCLLVGDSLGMVVQGQDSTLAVTLDEMIYHCRAVRRGAPQSFIIADMPFMSYATAEQAMANASALMQTGIHMVKLEGGAAWVFDSVTQLTQRGIPVCGHLGLTPQFVHQLGGYRQQGKTEQAANQLYAQATELVQAGIRLLVLECVPETVGKYIAQHLSIPVIGIGAGYACDGQVLVSYDMLGLTPGKIPGFAKNFMLGQACISDAFKAYVQAVKAQDFPVKNG
ncbi:3-methyl-2-oxobutanoate hydroxymethyltransferase [Candidatus Venteria ishoeyi]|uniref:3-methyl-2-oxobutanoate hydroxymethyltransferase n=1 Tax=Candidatus Venteria ishoeyi TaxID=1899563 RepID=A0A1H6FCI7_9GAMM|nr:3-methyl-2-oxobutanoate hydroxymethyltransferase [Candidatus Venteria ishoeyi]SEH07802.1 3-methyl-2-oxobutanoate hydroxymethyltransferase [Candidatus Venteria ishoeyi]